MKNKPEKDDWSFADWTEYWLQHIRPLTCCSNTCRDNRTAIQNNAMPFIEDKMMKDIVPEDIDSIYNDMRARGKVGNSIYYFSSILNQLFSHAVEYGIIDKNPCSPDQREPFVATPRVVYTAEEMKKIKEAIAGSYLRNAFLICLYNNIPLKDNIVLSWNDIDFENHIIHVRRFLADNNKRGKCFQEYDHVKEYPMSVKARKALEDELHMQEMIRKENCKEYNNIMEFVFTDKSGDMYSMRDCWAEYDQIKKDSGVADISVRTLRNQFKFAIWEGKDL